MLLTTYRTDLPQWVKENMQDLCPYCGCHIADNSDTGATTARWCLNPACPGHMMYKAEVLAKFFQITGFGARTALSVIRTHHFKSHIDFIPYWFKEKKPYVSLPDVAVLCCIENYGRPSAEKELGHYMSFTDYFNTPIIHNPILVEHKDELLYAEQFFSLKPPVSAIQMNVMGTGSFHGYSSRDEFFRLINEAYGMYIHVVQKGKCKTGISYLIKEADAIDHSKSQIARECGIPIVTPSEFISIIASKCPYIPEK